MLKNIQGDYIHCCLLCPWGCDTQLLDYRGTKNMVIFMHGNADDICSSKSYCQWLADNLVMNVLVFDYPGYGFSSGDPSEEGMEDAAVAVMEYATSKLKHDVSDIFIFGKSIGSYPAISLAAHPAFCCRVRGLVLVSPVASAARCIFDSYMIPSFLQRRLDGVALANINHIGNVQTLIFIIHGLEDEIVPVEHSHILLAHASSNTYYPPLWVQAGHNDIECLHQNLFKMTVTEFTRECEKREIRRRSSTSPYDPLTP